jgi:hypothetical protein
MVTSDDKRLWVERVLGIQVASSEKHRGSQAISREITTFSANVAELIQSEEAGLPMRTAMSAVVRQSTVLQENGRIDLSLALLNRAVELSSQRFQAAQNQAFDAKRGASAASRLSSAVAEAESIWTAAWFGAMSQVKSLADPDWTAGMGSALASIFSSYHNELLEPLAKVRSESSQTPATELSAAISTKITALRAEVVSDNLFDGLERQSIEVRSNLLAAMDQMTAIFQTAISE